MTSQRKRLRFERLESRRVLANLVVTSLADSGAGSLREAIAVSNSNGEADTISFAPGIAGGTIELTSGELRIGESFFETAINGSGETIDAGGRSRVLNVNDGDMYVQSTNVNLFNLTITGGAAPSDSSGGGIQSVEILDLVTVTITGNQADFGAGIANVNGVLQVANSMITSNVSTYAGGGGYFTGTFQETTIRNTTFSGNTVGSNNNTDYISTGAGISVSDGYFMMVNSTVSGNTATTAGTLYDQGGYGGGIFVNGRDNYSHSATIVDSMILNNVATNGAGDAGRGGNIYTSGYSNVVLEGSTVDGGYSASSGGNILFGGSSLRIAEESVVSGGNGTRGGGLYAFGGGTVEVERSTFENNTARTFGGGISLGPGANVILDRTFVQNNTVDAASEMPWGGGAFVAGAAGTSAARLHVVNRSEIRNNIAPGRGGGIGSMPLGTADTGEPGDTWFEINVDHSTVHSNTAGTDGGGIHNARGGITNVTERSVLSGNTASGRGGAISSFGFGCDSGECYEPDGNGQSHISVQDSVIDGNSANYGQVFASQYLDENSMLQGGPSIVSINRSALINALEGGAIDVTHSNLILKESTLSGNVHSRDGAGIGLFVAAPYAGYGGTMTYNATVENSTITANNSGSYAGGIYASYYGASLTLRGSIIASNIGSSGDVYDNSNGANTATDTIIGNNAGSAFSADEVLIGNASTPVDPMLSPLSRWYTHVPMPGSPAIDANHSNTSQEDQLGNVRPWDSIANRVGGVADIGSHEYLSINHPGDPSPDFNGDGVADCPDIDALQAEIVAGTNELMFDLNGDGLVDVNDQTVWLNQAAAYNGESFSSYQFSDFNLDGVVDVADFGHWNANKFTINSSFCSGDSDADGKIDVTDFARWNFFKFSSASDSAAPTVERPKEMAIKPTGERRLPN
ncbi:MAG: choice-of-anchor Q domain-containing protein, partial [Planctomycetota bacterium]